MRISDWSSDVCSSDLRLDQPHRGIGCVIKAIIAVGEEDMAAHLTGERAARLLHLRLDQAVAGLPHQGVAAQFDDAVEQRLRSEEHTSELQSLMRISYAVFCLKKKKNKT